MSVEGVVELIHSASLLKAILHSVTCSNFLGSLTFHLSHHGAQTVIVGMLTLLPITIPALNRARVRAT